MNKDLNEAELSLLAALRKARPSHVSGESLADHLGVSRVSIKTRLDRLKESGFQLDAVRSQGYALTAEPTELHPQLLELELRELGADIQWILLDECGSTNDEAMRRLTEGAASPLIVIARRQSAGRGRLGRRWHSEDSGNLMLSFAVRPDRPPAFMQRFTVWVGLRLAARLSEFSGARVQAKWPNDLLIDGHKLAGILTEARLDADRMRELILGLGLNINSAVDTWPVDVRAIATSLSKASNRVFSMSATTALIINELANSYHIYLEQDISDELNQLWRDFSAINGEVVTITAHEGEVRGKVIGLDPTSALILELNNGETRIFAAGDVSLSNQYSRD